ncbi:MAG TPA: hypothetical protein VK134_02495 [Ktedonobacteraceae bacterium]|nr:hypothetical protein [Ktedonobacteraceae bacterium]
MSQNTYLYEQLAAERHKDIQREMAHRQVLADLPPRQYTIGRHVISRFGALLVVLGTRLERVEPRRGHVARSIDVGI